MKEEIYELKQEIIFKCYIIKNLNVYSIPLEYTFIEYLYFQYTYSKPSTSGRIIPNKDCQPGLFEAEIHALITAVGNVILLHSRFLSFGLNAQQCLVRLQFLQ